MENYEKAEIDYVQGMKYKEIAEKYDTTINTVKSWKKRYGWNREKGAHKNEKGCTQKTKRAAVEKIEDDSGTFETLENEEMSLKLRMFCIYYSRTFNATQSYQKAFGCKYETAMVEGSRALRNPKVKREIARLKEIKRQQMLVGEEDLVELQMRIAFMDLDNYMEFGREKEEVIGPFGPIQVENPETGEKVNLTRVVNVVKLKESQYVDMQLIQEVSQGKNGVKIKFADRQKAIDWLTKYFEINPMDKHRKEFDKRKLEIELLKLEMQTKESEEAKQEKDNFLDALNQTAQEVWTDE